jgi:glucose-6-phosphate 1-dehydrogenase
MLLMTLVALEPPPAVEPNALRDAMVMVLRSIRPIERKALHVHAMRAQYREGRVGGQAVPGYQDEAGVAPGSTTETFVAVKLLVDNWRWRGVPFYLRTGKRLGSARSFIAIRFKHPPQQLFRETALEEIEPNWIVLSIQPSETMNLEIHARQPGLGMHTRLLQLNAGYRGQGEQAIGAYEALLLDIIRGDQTNFIRFDEVEWAWRVVEPVLRFWAQERGFIHTYPAGSSGPQEANRLFEWDYQRWREEP